MIEKTGGHANALIILHEIYGANRFIEDLCTEYHLQGFDIFCPEMLGRNSFPYAGSAEAYDYFSKNVGFDYDKEIKQLIEKLKLLYDKVFIMGFSVGATIAWKCCEDTVCDGIICFYGSRIRDYLLLQPCCPVLLLFAAQDSFDVDSVINKLQGKSNVDIQKLRASHGFMDPYSNHFVQTQAQMSKNHISDFIGSLA